MILVHHPKNAGKEPLEGKVRCKEFPKPPEPRSQTIEWTRAYRTVRNLRHRIFRATQEGNLKKVRALQKLMLKSYSNRLVSVRRVTQVNAGKKTHGMDSMVVKSPAAKGKLVDALGQYTAWKDKPACRVYISLFCPLLDDSFPLC